MLENLPQELIRITLIASKNGYDQKDIENLLCSLIGQQTSEPVNFEAITQQHLNSLKERVSTHKFEAISTKFAEISLSSSAASSSSSIEKSTTLSGRPRGQSRSPDSDSDKQHVKKEDFAGKRREGNNKDGEGDHTIPYCAIEQALFAIIEDTDAHEIPGQFNAISQALKLGNICEDTPELRQTFIQIASLREERKLLTQRIRGARIAKEDFNNAGITQITNLSDILDISVKTEYQSQLSHQLVTDITDRAKGLIDITANIEEERLGQIKDALHTIETNLSRQILIPIAKEFLKRLNKRPGVANPKARIEIQRTKRLDNAQSVIEFLVQQKFYHVKAQSQTDSDYRLDIIDFLKTCGQAEKQTLAANLAALGYPDQDIDQAITNINLDLYYSNRILGEGAKVKMAMYGLRAFNKLIAISNQETISPEGLAKKRKMIQDFKDDTNLRSGICGTRVNPTFALDHTHQTIQTLDETDPLWNITRDNDDLLNTMCQRAGELFDRAIDFERQIVDPTDQKDIDQEQLKSLYKTSAEAIIFMFQTFKNLKTLPGNLQNNIIHSFAHNIINNQGWGNISLFDDEDNQIPLTDLLLTETHRLYDNDTYTMNQIATTAAVITTKQITK